jgi:hypothetical protein
MGTAAAGEAELPQFCGGPVVAVDGLIHCIGVGLAGAVAVDRCSDVAEQSDELRLVVGADPFLRGAVRLSWPRCDGTALQPDRPRARGSPAVLIRDVVRQCRGLLISVTIEPGTSARSACRPVYPR